MKYAVFESGGKQYVARPGESVEVDRLEAEQGQTLELSTVLLAVNGDSVTVGRPQVEGARVKATVEGQIKGPKIVVYRYIPKERYRRKRGHRQVYTRLHIDELVLPGSAADDSAEGAATPAPAASKPARPRSARKAPAAKKPAARKKKAE